MVCSFASLVGGEFAAGEHHHGYVAEGLVVANLLEHFEAGHVGELQIQHHAVRGIFAKHGEGIRAGFGGGNFDVLVAQEFGDALALGFVVLDQAARRLRRGAA